MCLLVFKKKNTFERKKLLENSQETSWPSLFLIKVQVSKSLTCLSDFLFTTSTEFSFLKLYIKVIIYPIFPYFQ